MNGGRGAAALAAAAMLCASAAGAAAATQQQEMLLVPTGDQSAKPVPQTAVDATDSPEEIAKDAAGDLKDSRFYNKPGATRAQYNADWQQCRLIARGSRTPSGSVPFFYNPAVISPLAAGIGGGIGGFIAGKIKEGQLRRANRRTCLMIRGWRLVEVPPAEAARVAAMTDAQRSGYFDTLVGAPTVSGKVTERLRFTDAPDPALRLATPLSAPGLVWAGKKVDPATFAVAPGEAVLVVAFRRTEPATLGKSGAVTLLRYDPAARDVIYRPQDWKKTGDRTTYDVSVPSREKKAAYEVQLHRVTPGAYVLDSLSSGTVTEPTTHCFGAPMLRVAAGEVLYLGDFGPFSNAKLLDGTKVSTLVHAANPEDARRTLATKQPRLAAAMKPAAWQNRATYACAGVTMTRWDMAGVPGVETAARE